jgi:hypothetical protein
MSFRLWLEKEEINEPYYRIIAIPLYGHSNVESENIGPGTYWTPRWDAILFMAQHIFKVWNDKKYDYEGWFDTTIYQLNKAIMDDAPKEHKWAFTYGVDAGEKILVQALEKPKIIFQGHPKSPKFMGELLLPSLQYKRPFDYSYKGTNKLIKWKNKNIYVAPNYDDECIDVVEKEGWRYRIIQQIHNLAQWRKFEKEANIPEGFYDSGEVGDTIDWFMFDMKWI